MFTRFKYFDFIRKNEDRLYDESFQINIGNLLPNQYEREKGDSSEFLYAQYYEEELLVNHKEAEKIVIYVTPYIFLCNTQIIWYEYEKDFINSKDFVSNTNFAFSINLLYRRTHYDITYSASVFAENSGILNYFQKDNENNLSAEVFHSGEFAKPVNVFDSMDQFLGNSSILEQIKNINLDSKPLQEDLLKQEDLLDSSENACFSCNRGITSQILRMSVCFGCLNNLFFKALKAKYNEFLNSAKDLFALGKFDKIALQRGKSSLLSSILL